MTTSRVFKFLLEFFFQTLLPIILVGVVFYLYLKGVCYISTKSSSASLICGMNWKDGLILVLSYDVVKIISPPLEFNSVTKRLTVTLFLYCFSYALIAFPYWLVSFFQDFLNNTFIHTTLIIVAVELLFERLSKRRGRAAYNSCL
jgi:hypothetical protein